MTKRDEISFCISAFRLLFAYIAKGSSNTSQLYGNSFHTCR